MKNFKNEFAKEMSELKSKIEKETRYSSITFSKDYQIFYAYSGVNPPDWQCRIECKVWVNSENLTSNWANRVFGSIYPPDSGTMEDCQKRLLRFIKENENEFKELFYAKELKKLLDN